MEQKVKKRAWVKNVAIIFLAVLLVLTFFSQTIMNRSLPEVAASYAQSGTINAKVRGSGTVTAVETYQVKVDQSRKVQSVSVSLGDEVEVGDLLMVLAAGDSDELQVARDELAAAELNYQKTLINATSADYAKENRAIQKAREDLQEAQATLNLYSPVDPTVLKNAEDKVTSQKAAVAAAQAALDAAQAELDSKGGYQPGTEGSGSSTAQREAWERAKSDYNAVKIRYGTDYDALQAIAKKMVTANKGTNYKSYSAEDWMKALAASFDENGTSLPSDIQNGVFTENSDGTITVVEGGKSYQKQALATAYKQVTEADIKVDEAYQAYRDAQDAASGTGAQNVKEYKAVQNCQKVLNSANTSLTTYQNELEKLTEQKTRYDEAKTAVETLEDSISDQLFALQEQQKADGKTQATEALDLKDMKSKITSLRKKVDELEGSGTGGGEIRAEAAGIISAVNVTAGNTAEPEAALLELEVPDRGYQLSISVESDQARKVKVGDRAELTNYWGPDLEIVLRNIRSDPQSQGGQKKLLVFSVSGEVESGANLNVSVGAQSANYDVIVPKSAIHSDADGDFVYVVNAKSTPLGNRYTAAKVSVKVLAQDDVNAAISGGVAAYDYVITTSNAPITPGSQVRLAENMV